MDFRSILNELKRRNLYKVAIAYGITGWVIVQVASIAASTFGAPGWVMKMLITVLLLGFPVAMIVAWAFEITPEGLKRTREVPAVQSVTNHTDKQLNYWIIGLLSAALLFLLSDRFWFQSNSGPLHRTQEAAVMPSVAVLPFNDFSPANDQEWFSDGLTEELLNSLARLQGLRVAARTSSFHFKNKNIPIQQIADTLGVEHIVEGSVRRSDSTMRITAQLIRASDGFHLWSQTYDRNIDDVFKVQEDISENIASVLNVYLDQEEREKMRAYGTRDVEAYVAYLKGRNLYDKFHLSSIDSSMFTKAAPWFEKAIELDPEFAAPYYFLADPYTHYILEYPAIRIDSLSLDRAHNRILDYLGKAILHTNDPGQRLIYRFERTFLSDNWSAIPDLVQQLKNSDDARRAFAMIGGGWTRSFLNPMGHARLQHNLNAMALKRDPLDQSTWTSNMQSLMAYAAADTIFSVIEKLQTMRGSEMNPGNYYFVYTFSHQFDKADSVARLISTHKSHPFNVFTQAVRGNREIAKANFDSLQNDNFKNSFNSAFFHYVLGDIEKANTLALQIDTTTLGPIKLLMQSAINTGGFMPFSVDSMPKLGLLLRQAGVSVEPYALGAVRIPRIVQRPL